MIGSFCHTVNIIDDRGFESLMHIDQLLKSVLTWQNNTSIFARKRNVLAPETCTT